MLWIRKQEKNNMSNKELSHIRELLAIKGLKGFIIPRTDAYLGEYVPASAERLEYMTGFTGSAGAAIILDDAAVVMSDGRYTIQLEQQVDKEAYETANSQETKMHDWILAHSSAGDAIGYDPKLHTADEVTRIEEAGVTLQAVDENLVDMIWAAKPAEPMMPVTLFDEKFAGRSIAQKKEELQKKIKDEDCISCLLTMSDSIAWLLNIRGGDLPFIPVCLSYALVPVSGKIMWFLNQHKISPDIRQALEAHVEFYDEREVQNFLKAYDARDKVWIDEKRSPIYFKNIIVRAGAQILDKEDPCLIPRACKNEAEIAAMKNAHIRDAVAFAKFEAWLHQNWQGQTELSVEAKLQEFRAQAQEFKEPSFSTIAGYGEHGAVVHYRATDESDAEIGADSILLLDSGAQYEDGTTDITRNYCFGQKENEPTAEMKEDYTLVLKGHIALASAVFKKGTTGVEIDNLARQFLAEKGKNYAHGTGHGVGCYLSVHEESASISRRSDRALEAGMILSNEPGFYKEGEYGIRIENLVLVKEHDAEHLCFETITLVPIATNLIDYDLMSEDEVKWLNDYHAQVKSAMGVA